MTDLLDDIRGAFDKGVDGFKRGPDGMLDIELHQQEPAPAAAAPTPPAPAQDDPYEARYKEVQGWATRVAQENANLKRDVAEMRGAMQELSKAVRGEETPGEPELDLSDPEALQNFINQQIERGVNERVKRYEPAIKQAESDQELRDFVLGPNGIGQETWDLWGPAMLEEADRLLSAGLPVPEFPKLYQMTQQLYEPVPSDVEGDAGTADGGDAVDQPTTVQADAPAQVTPVEPPPVAHTAEELQARAARTRVEQGVAPTEQGAGVPTSEPAVVTPRDAMQAAYAELEGGNG